MSLIVPAAGNCKDNTILICRVSGENVATSRRWIFNAREIFSGGQSQAGVPEGKYTETLNGSDIRLSVNSFKMSDAGSYRCTNKWSASEIKNVSFECKYYLNANLYNNFFLQFIVISHLFNIIANV